VTPDQQKEFLALFRELLQRAYVQKLLLFENPNFIFADQQPAGKETIVDTKIVTPRDQFDVSYKLIRAGDNWMATSITVEDVSLTASLSSQLNELLGRMSVDDLLTLIRRKYVAGGESLDAKTLAAMPKDLRLISRDRFGLVGPPLVRILVNCKRVAPRNSQSPALAQYTPQSSVETTRAMANTAKSSRGGCPSYPVPMVKRICVSSDDGPDNNGYRYTRRG
jgi:hypothetical protein